MNYTINIFSNQIIAVVQTINQEFKTNYLFFIVIEFI